jgi:hypothetical protein
MTRSRDEMTRRDAYIDALVIRSQKCSEQDRFVSVPSAMHHRSDKHRSVRRRRLARL